MPGREPGFGWHRSCPPPVARSTRQTLRRRASSGHASQETTVLRSLPPAPPLAMTRSSRTPSRPSATPVPPSGLIAMASAPGSDGDRAGAILAVTNPARTTRACDTASAPGRDTAPALGRASMLVGAVRALPRAAAIAAAALLAAGAAMAADRHVYLDTNGNGILNDCPNPAHNAKGTSNTDDL